MITVITGTPGAGKTLYAIQKLLLPLVGTDVVQVVDGITTIHPRTIYTNIKGLTIDHELIDGGDENGLRDWHLWAKPGAVIVFDEVQKIWAPRSNGSQVPDDIQALETHRHMGVDFILITQNVMLVDRNIHALGGRHLHVRRIANMPFATVYEWDHISRQLLFAKAITKSPFRHDKRVYKLYHSADLHTKQPRKLPGVLWFFVLAAALLIWKAPVVYDGLTGKPATSSSTSSKPVAAAAPGAAGQAPAGGSPAVPGQAAHRIDDATDWTPRVSARPESAPAYDELRKVTAMPVVSAGFIKGKIVRCYTQQGTDAGLTEMQCREWLTNTPFNPYAVPKLEVQPSPAPDHSRPSEALSAPTLVVLDGPGYRDPAGVRNSAR
ncbi:zona occludens toxin [Variovorax sp. OK605]|uniref:zonular occludens toxin domain-containing protein n=1 Tax=Variovorax sp. OK605 TaxID=1855317 RepID=UPI0008F1EF91|nr:zonular occludens toxin domain-containing protein [Variovorax sp. OK605]SFQ68771.1 zona occludens toxin [Variovorax sp. OK605]